MKVKFKYTTGILLAATGVGAGDLITGGLLGLTMAFLWSGLVLLELF